ncbi:MAG: efflux RND transporter periplasmic adaptor subunit [Verrucomicrobiota bacterium]
MSSAGNSDSPSKQGPLLMAGLALLLVGVVAAIVMVIQRAPTAGTQGGGGPIPEGPPPAAVFATAVQTSTAQDESIVTGTLRAVSRADIAAHEAESVIEVFADEGDQVKKGAKLVQLDKRRTIAQLAEAKAQLQSAAKLVSQREAELKRANSDLEMKQGLLSDKAISKSEFLDAERELAVADAQAEAAKQAVAEAESRIELMEIRRKDLEISAPFSGVIAERHVEIGEWVNTGESVMTLVSVDPVEAWLSVPERYLGDVSAKPDAIQVRLSSSGEIFTPTLVSIVPDVEPTSQLFTVVATLENKKGNLAAGQSITGIVPVGKDEPHYSFPVDALVRSRMGDFVFVVDASGEGPMPAARQVPVAVNFERFGMAFVRAKDASLSKDDRVVIEGNDRLMPGQPLMVQEKGEPKGPMPKL